ncbi:hypothetical protein BH09ACT12_BH09ACT12_17760 [soil metagenome]
MVPVAVASALWTAHLAAPQATPAVTTTAMAEPVPALPDGSLVPDHEIDLPASISPSRELRAATDGRFAAVSSRPSAGDIPAVALAAYQRAESLLGSADVDCNLSWQLIAAIGRVESDHGRFGGSSLGADGITRPAIIGPVLDGANGTALIRDTDAGRLDGDAEFDRAVGPLQFIPSTWAVVGVDGDGDGARDPQDIDDAALAAAVYLCSGQEDLATPQGLRSAVLRYNNSAAYVDTVVSIMDRYLAGRDVSIPSATSVGAGMIVALVPLDEQDDVKGAASPGAGSRGPRIEELRAPAQDSGERAPLGLTDPTGPTEHNAPQEQPEPAEPVEADPSAEPEPTEPTPTDEPTDEPSDEPTDHPTDEPSDEATDEPSDEAVEFCTLEEYVDDPEVIDDEYDLCVAEYDDPADPAGTEPTGAPTDVPEDAPEDDPATQLPLASSID